MHRNPPRRRKHPRPWRLRRNRPAIPRKSWPQPNGEYEHVSLSNREKNQAVRSDDGHVGHVLIVLGPLSLLSLLSVLVGQHIQRDHRRPEFLEDFHAYADLVCLQPITFRASILVVTFKSPFNGQFQFCNEPCRARPLRMLATFWQCCLASPWHLGWMPQEQ